MNIRGFWIVYFSVCKGALRDFSECHDDFDLHPPDGILNEHNTFTWVGFLQYLHVSLGIQHFSRAPRVVLVQKQFVLATTADLFKLPQHYKLGHVIFGQYERDEADCGLKETQAKIGVKCGPAYLEIPYATIIPHPEYTRFRIGNSLALLKLQRPLQSHYMIPICLPSVRERQKQRKDKSVFMIDYISPVPTDFDEEKIAKKTLKLFTHKDCRRHRSRSKLGGEGVSHALCSSGCGIRTGAPIVTHAVTGAFQLVGLAASSGPCATNAMRSRLNHDPPIYIDVYPYVSWIINIVTAHILPQSYPQRFMLTSAGHAHRKVYETGGALRQRVPQKEGWSKRTYKVGNWCYKTTEKQKELYFFYSEKFEAKCGTTTRLTVFIRISAGIECTICCVRLMLPSRMATPKILGVGGYNISIEFQTKWFPYNFYFTLGLTGKNSTPTELNTYLSEMPNPGYWY